MTEKELLEEFTAALATQRHVNLDGFEYVWVRVEPLRKLVAAAYRSQERKRVYARRRHVRAAKDPAQPMNKYPPTESE